jgi:hypothetical protein
MWINVYNELMTPIPLTLQTLYADLVQHAHAVSVRGGSVYRQTVKGVGYLYARATVGVSRRDQFLGRADDPEAQARADEVRSEAKRASERRRTVRILRAQGVPAPATDLGRVLDALADAGLFKQAVLVGTAAYQCYSPIVGFVLPAAALMTQDADLATASLALASDEGEETLQTILRRADKTFTSVPKLDPRAPPSRFRNASGFLVDLLTPQLRRSDKNPMPLKQLAAGAVPMQHLGWLIEDPIQAVALHGAGVPVRIPTPARYGVHKLIVAQKRGAENVKRQKDLMQARALIEALARSDPWAWNDAINDAEGQGATGWARPIRRSLKELWPRQEDRPAL